MNVSLMVGHSMLNHTDHITYPLIFMKLSTIDLITILITSVKMFCSIIYSFFLINFLMFSTWYYPMPQESHLQCALTTLKI